MAKITKDDLFGEGLFDDLSKGADEATRELKDLEDQLKSIGKIGTELRKADALNPLKTDEDIRKRIETLRQMEGLLKLQEKATIRINKIRAEEKKNIEAQAKAQEKANKETSRAAKEQAKLNSVYEQSKKRLNDVKKELKELFVRGQQNTEQYKKLRKEFDTLDKTVRSAEEHVGEFNRNVGNYKESIREAIKETGLFSGKLGEIFTSLEKTGEELKKATKEGKNFGTAMKLGLVGVAIGAIKFLDALSDININLSDFKERALAITQGFTPSYIKSVQDARKEFRTLSLAIEDAQEEQQDLAEIAADATLGFQTREEAAKKAIETEKIRAGLAVQIAELELSQAEAAIKSRESIVGVGNATNDLLQKRTEAQIKLKDATDQLNDAQRIGEEKLREIQQKRLANTINVIQGEADIKAEALKKQLEDERKQLDERRKINEQFNAQQANVFNREIKQFDEILGKQIDGNRLLSISNAELLQQELDKLDIGDKAQDALLKVIVARQKALNDYKENLKKLDEEERQRQERIEAIQRERAINAQQAVVDARTEDLETTQEVREKNLQQLLEDENVFSRKKRELRKLLVEREKADNEELLNERLILLDLERDAEIKAAEKSITDEKILAEEKLKIQEEYQRKKENLLVEGAAKEGEIKEKSKDEERLIQEQQLKIVAKYASKSLDAISDALDKRGEAENDAIDRAIENNETAIDRQRALAEKGLSNQLAFEEQKRAQLELAREQQAKREQRRELILGFLKSWAGYAEQDPNTALQKAFVDLGTAKLAEVLVGLPAFKDGVEGLDGPGTETSDSILSRLSKGESVVTAKGTKENPGLATAMNNGTVDKYFLNTYTPSFASNVSDSVGVYKLLNKRLISLESTIKNKPETTVRLDNLGNVIEERVAQGTKQTIRHLSKKPRLG